MATLRHTIRNMPLRGGLTTAGQHGTIPENALWRAENVSTGLDGLLSKRPGLWQWGQVLKFPAGSDDVWFYEEFKSTDNWVGSGDSNNVIFGTNNNELQVNIIPNTVAAETEIFGRAAVGSQDDSDDADWALRFTARSSNMPADGEFIVSAKARVADDPHAFRITGEAVQYYAVGDTWETLYTFAFKDRGATTFEFRVADDEVDLYINEELVASQDSLNNYVAMTEGTYVEFHFVSDDVDSQYSVYITDLMLEGTVTDPFTAQRVGAGTDYRTLVGGAALRRHLLVAGPKFLYQDADLRKRWSPLMELTGGNVTFTHYGNELLVFDADNGFGSKAYRWNGVDPPELLDDAPPVRFASEHRTRIFAAGDRKHALRVYYSASRSPNMWFAPDSDADGQETQDEVLEAGYVNIPGKEGDEVVALAGEFYGSCVVVTTRGVWRITGSSPESFSIENIVQDAGGASQAGMARLGNDLWIAGRQGVTTIATVQQFGDMQAAWPSGPIADLWAPGISNSSIKVDQYQLYRTSLAWNPNLSLMYLAFARQGASDVSSIYVFNPVNQSWTGPWTGDTTFVASVEIASPVVQIVMHGTSTGHVGMTDPSYKADFGEAYSATIESAYMCGRSVDPTFTSKMKTWKSLRLYVQIRGDWDINLRWQVDNETYLARVESQNVFDVATLGHDWRLGVDMLHSNQLIGVIDIPIDVRGRFFKFDISTEDAVIGEDLVLQGYEVEFTTSEQ